jgi:hypothetical protein
MGEALRLYFLLFYAAGLLVILVKTAHMVVAAAHGLWLPT